MITPNSVYSAERLKRLSEAMKTRWVAGMISPHTGFKHSEATKQKMSLAKLGKLSPLKGRPSPFKGIKRGPYSLERRENISKSLQGIPRPNRRGVHHPLFGKYGKDNPTFGEKHGNWRGGTKRLNKHLRDIQLYKNWRKKVFERDNFTCQFCMLRGGELNADHFPKPLWQIIKDNNITEIENVFDCVELWDISNGRTLCVGCHRKTETWGYRPDIILNYTKV